MLRSEIICAVRLNARAMFPGVERISLWKRQTFKGYHVFFFRPGEGVFEKHNCEWQGALDKILGIPVVVLEETGKVPIPENIAGEMDLIYERAKPRA